MATKEFTINDLDELVSNLEKTFKDVNNFQQDEENPNCYWTCDTEVDYPIDRYLIDFNEIGNVNWDSVEYLKQRGWKVYAGERDSFGWLTGIIEPIEITREVLGLTDKTKKYIMVFG